MQNTNSSHLHSRLPVAPWGMSAEPNVNVSKPDLAISTLFQLFVDGPLVFHTEAEGISFQNSKSANSSVVHQRCGNASEHFAMNSLRDTLVQVNPPIFCRILEEKR
jgi:hypothetical protein